MVEKVDSSDRLQNECGELSIKSPIEDGEEDADESLHRFHAVLDAAICFFRIRTFTAQCLEECDVLDEAHHNEDCHTYDSKLVPVQNRIINLASVRQAASILGVIDPLNLVTVAV